jgi:predicted DNA-binding protein (MmcQ/YjbR family)
MPADSFHDRLLQIVTSLPGAYEDRPWGEPHCKVAGKIFVGWGRDDDGRMSVGFKTDKELQAMLVTSDPRFKIAAYVGKHGWVNMKLDPDPSWEEVESFIVDSYRRIAPRKLVKELDARQGGAKAPAPVKKRASAAAKRKASAPAKKIAAPRAAARKRQGAAARTKRGQ